MNIFAKNSFLKKFVVTITLIVMLSNIFPKRVEASLGGTLMKPISALFVGIGDGIMTVIDLTLVKQDTSVHHISTKLTLTQKIGLGLLFGLRMALNPAGAWGRVLAGFVIQNLFSPEEPVKVDGVEYLSKSNVQAARLDDNEEVYLPEFGITPYKIFSDEDNIFSVNFFKKDIKDDTMLGIVSKYISDVYKQLRLIAVVGMLSVLVYIGIRITISSAADSRAKYKQRLVDWAIGMLLLFTMHYIMSFANLFVDQLNDVFSLIKIDDSSEVVEINGEQVEASVFGITEDGTIDSDTTPLIQNAYRYFVENNEDEESKSKYEKYFRTSSENQIATSADDAVVMFWPASDFLDQARIRLQLQNNSSGNEEFGYIGFVVIYFVLVIFTCIFIFVYLRRFIYMTFLTLISPLVALTYPIDKIKDGQAQAFNFWFKEYMYNLLLQPLHLLVYMIVVGSAMRFAADHPLYVIVCLGFMVPLEKLIKEMFGFKGKTPGAIPGMAAGALMMETSRRLFGRKPPEFGKALKGGDSSKGEGGESNISGKLNSPSPFAVMSGASNGDQGSEEGKNINMPKPQSQIPGGFGLPVGVTGGWGQPVKRKTNNKVIKGVKAVGSSIWENKGKIGKAALKGGAVAAKTALKGEAMLAGAALGGMATIVGGDPSKLGQNVAIGAAALGKVPNMAIGATSKAVKGVGKAAVKARDSIEEEYYADNPEALQRKQNARYAKQLENNQEFIKKAKNNLSKEQRDRLKKENGVNQYINSGITNSEDIVLGERLMAENGWDRATAISALQIEKKIGGGKYGSMHPDDQEKWNKRLKKEFLKVGNNEAQANANVKRSQQVLEQIPQIRTQLK